MSATHAADRYARRAGTVWCIAGVLVIVAVSWIGVVFAVRDAPGGSHGAGLWARLADFAAALGGRASPMSPNPQPGAFRDTTAWWRMAQLAHETLAMSVLAIWVSMAGMALTVMAGARPGAGTACSFLRKAACRLVRAVWIVTRAVPELVWALLLVLIMPPGALAGALALGLHNFGIVSKLCAEVVENVDPRPARALRAAGASPSQVLLYALLPQVLPQFLTFVLYRWEVIIRTTIVVGFVSAGGLGREFRLAMSHFHFTDITMILITYLALVVGVDVIAARLRRLAA